MAPAGFAKSGLAASSDRPPPGRWRASGLRPTERSTGRRRGQRRQPLHRREWRRPGSQSLAWRHHQIGLPLGDGGPAAFAQLSAPQGVAVDSGGSLYIGENGAGRVRKVWPGGIITTVAGTGSYGFSGDGGAATDAQLSHLSGLALDSAHNLYIADYGNSRIRMVSFGGLITTIAGDGSNIPSYTGDGGLATAAQLNLPSGVAVGMDGNLYIAAAGDHRLRRVSAGGFIATVAGNGVVGY